MCFPVPVNYFPLFRAFPRSVSLSLHHDPSAQLWWKLDLIVPGGYPSVRFKGPWKSPHYIDTAVKSSLSHPYLGQRNTAGCGLVSIQPDCRVQPLVLYCSPAGKGQNSMGKQSVKASQTLTQDSQIHTGCDYMTVFLRCVRALSLTRMHTNALRLSICPCLMLTSARAQRASRETCQQHIRIKFFLLIKRMKE